MKQEEAEALRQQVLPTFPDAVVTVEQVGHYTTAYIKLTDKVVMFTAPRYGFVFLPHLSEEVKAYARYTGYDKFNPAYKTEAPNKMNVWKSSAAKKWVERHSAAYDYILEKYQTAKLDFDATIASIKWLVKPGMSVIGHPLFSETGKIIADMTNGKFVVYWEANKEQLTSKVKVAWEGDLTRLAENLAFVPTYDLTWEALDLLGAIRLLEKPGYRLYFEVLTPCGMLGKGLVDTTFAGKTPGAAAVEVETRKAWIASFTKLFS